MKKVNTLILVILIGFITGSLLASDVVMVDVNLDMNHTNDTITSLDRKKYITMHMSLGDPDLGAAEIKNDELVYLLEELDVYTGRNNGAWYIQYLNQDATRPGYAQDASINYWGDYNVKNGYDEDWQTRHDDKSDDMMGGQPHAHYLQYKPGDWKWASAEAVGEFQAKFINRYRKPGDNNVSNGMKAPRFYQILNEPLYQMTDDSHSGMSATPLEIFQYHRDVAKEFKKHNTTGTLVGGWVTAFPEIDYNDFSQWDERWKLFIDTAGSEMDFYTIHLYDIDNHYKSNYKEAVQYKGAREEAIMDMIENYTYLKEGETKPWVISEYGNKDGREPVSRTLYSRERDWTLMKGYMPHLMQLMDKPNNVLKTLPFLEALREWDVAASGYPYPWRLFRRANEPEEYSGDIIFTEMIKFYQLWDNVNGKRADSWSVDPDVLVDSYVEGNTAYVILCNMTTDSKDIKLNLNGLNGNTVSSVMMKHLHAVNELPTLDTTITSSLNEFTIDPEANIVIAYDFASDITMDQTSAETKYYGNKVKQAIEANSSVEFDINGVTKAATGEAILRLSFGRDQDLSKEPIVKVNDTIITYASVFSGDDNQTHRDAFFGMLEIYIPYSVLDVDNTLSVEFPDAGGFISSATMRVFNFSREVERANVVAAVNIYPDNLELGVGQERILTAEIFPKNAYDKRVKWMSSDASVKVDSTGVITGVTNGGSAIITAKTIDGGYTATCNVSVQADRVLVLPDTIIFTTISADLVETKTLQLDYEILPVDTDDKSVTWTASNSNATVENGLVTAINEGSVNVTASVAGGKTNMCAFNIIDRVSGSIVIKDESSYSYIEEGKSLYIECNYTATTGETVSGVSFYLNLLDEDENIVKSYASHFNARETELGTASATIGSMRATRTADLPFGQYYALEIRAKESDGSEIVKTISPVVIKNGVGIEEGVVSSISIYPNPATEIVNIKGNYPNSKVYIYDLVGSVVITSNSNNIDVSGLSSGAYIIKIGNYTNRLVIE